MSSSHIQRMRPAQADHATKHASPGAAGDVQLKAALRGSSFAEGEAMLAPGSAPVQMKGGKGGDAKKSRGGGDLMALHEADALAARAERKGGKSSGGGGDLMALHEADALAALTEMNGGESAECGEGDLMALHEADALAALAEMKGKKSPGKRKSRTPE